MDDVKGRQLTLADTVTKRTQRQTPVSCEIGPKDGPEHDLQDHISLAICMHIQQSDLTYHPSQVNTQTQGRQPQPSTFLGCGETKTRDWRVSQQVGERYRGMNKCARDQRLPRGSGVDDKRLR